MDEYIIKARFEDALKSASYKTKFLGFLDPKEALYLNSLAKYQNDGICTFWGGYDDAERVFLAVGNSEIMPEEFPFSTLEFTFRDVDSLNHRDFLGYFMSQGVTRPSIGDILVESGRAVVFVKDELKSYFLNGTTKIGKVGVKCKLGASFPLPVAHSFKDLQGVVASERADCIIAFLLKSSREKAVQAIKSGIVTLNYTELKSVSQKLNNQDKISVKGHGKFLIEDVTQYTKKDRIIIKCKKYI